MSRSKSSTVRNAFLIAAKDIFLEVGLEQATMDAIAAKSGSAKSTLYRYFESKEALFSALLTEASSLNNNEMMNFLYQSGNSSQSNISFEDFINSLEFSTQEGDIQDDLIKFGQYIITNFYTPKALAVRRMMITASTNSEIGQQFYLQGSAKVIEKLENIFKTLINTGYFYESNPHVVACHYFGLLGSEINEASLYNVSLDLNDKEITSMVHRSVETFMRAYRSPNFK
ncbi:TetR/AcrR family transcriptional regulator [Acinetobacter pittii]|uniref:TetR/AcrR family transcriptional regulator n=1 Tax=Acinetobacter pittii TaxID=48296 RepID=UPI001ABFD943|nr:TetR/AcrR family transcriptional regulator [Acinetobacter pittii]QDB81936.1 TetR/AcrR family transcriptional regulator [Acinetobacter pittii]